MQRQRQRGLDAAQRQPLEHPRIADGGEDQVLVADAAGRAEQVDGLEHGVEVVRRLAHAHEHHLVHAAARTGQRHLGDDLGTAQLAQQPALPGHAEPAADRAAHLRRHTQAVARQQHAFHGLAVGQLQQQTLRTILARMRGMQTRQRLQLGQQLRQRLAQRQWQEILDAAPAGVLRPGPRPVAQHTFLVRRLRAQRHAAGGGCRRFAWPASCLARSARATAARSQGRIRPITFSAPSWRRSTTPSPDIAPSPLSALMFTWCVNTTRLPRSRQPSSSARAAAVCAGSACALAEEGVECRHLAHRPQRCQVGGLAHAAPLRAPHRAHQHLLAPQPFADAPRLRAAGLVQVALGAAVAEPHARRVADARRVGMPEQHDGAAAQRRPGGLFVRAGLPGQQHRQGQAQGAASDRHRWFHARQSGLPNAGVLVLGPEPDAPWGHEAGCRAGR